MSIKVRYDEHARDWVASVQGFGTIRTHRLVIDAPARVVGGKLVFGDVKLTIGAQVKGDNYEALHIDLTTPRPKGRVKDEIMREWVVRFDPADQLWHVWREDASLWQIATCQLEFDCHAISSEDRLHCKAEALVDGATYKGEPLAGVRHPVKLRTLIVYNQDVLIPPIAWGRSTARA